MLRVVVGWKMDRWVKGPESHLEATGPPVPFGKHLFPSARGSDQSAQLGARIPFYCQYPGGAEKTQANAARLYPGIPGGHLGQMTTL